MCISLAWIVDVLIPGFGGPALYSFRGDAVHAGSLLVALAGVATFTWLNYRGVRSAASFQDWMTSNFALAMLFIVAGILGGTITNLRQPFRMTPEGSIWPGIVAVLITTPWWLGGFNTVSQMLEEERSELTSLRVVVRLMVFSILAAALFYALVLVSSQWRRRGRS